MSGWRGPGTLVLITHGESVRPLIGSVPRQAEALVFKPGGSTELPGFSSIFQNAAIPCHNAKQERKSPRERNTRVILGSQ